jgi:repressor of nif and glnA expression
MTKTMLAILKVLDKQHDTILGSREISRQLKSHGIQLTERTVRYHLRILDERGFTKVFGKEGRMITQKGKEELSQALVSEKVGFVISKIETLSYLTNLDLEKKEGDIILNVSYFPEKKLKEAIRIMKPVFSSPYVMSDNIVLHKSGDKIGDIVVPKGQVGFGTVCSVTINGIFLKSKMTDVISAVKNHNGKILASFREIPIVCLEKAKELSIIMKEKGIGGILLIGNPNQPLLEMPVAMDKAGMIIVGGLNPIAALEETGIKTVSKAMSTLYRYYDLINFKELLQI